MIEIEIVFKSGTTRIFRTEFKSDKSAERDAEKLVTTFGKLTQFACRTHPDGGWVFVRPDDVSFISAKPVPDGE